MSLKDRAAIVGIGQLPFSKNIGRPEEVTALEAAKLLSRTEGIIPALESAHAVAYAVTLVPRLRPDQMVIINLSGRGDKDLQGVARFSGELQ